MEEDPVMTQMIELVHKDINGNYKWIPYVQETRGKKV